MARRSRVPPVCVSLGFLDPESLIACAREETEQGNRFLEFRLDHLRNPWEGLTCIQQLLQKSPLVQILATCRRQEYGGKFRGSVDEQLRILDSAVEAGARWVDLEIEVAEQVPERVAELASKTQLILSYHDFQSTPALERTFNRMKRLPATAYKIATTPRKPSDNWRLLSFARRHLRSGVVAVGMGELGFCSRLLATAYGSLYTYAAPTCGPATAPGQPSSRELRQLYRIEQLTRLTKVYGVIGDPIEHSISPAVHNHAFQTCHLDAVYLPFRVLPGQLRDFFALAERLRLSGCSVTIPHKQKVLRYLDQVDPLACRIGAVNTVWRHRGRWRGTNTDVDGVRGPLQKRIRLPNARILIAGNGGAARAAAFALVDEGAEVFITARNSERGQQLARACGARFIARENLAQHHFDVVIHATPLGMYPNVDSCFFEDAIPADIVFDMVYNPVETVLVRRAREQGKVVITGLEMFLEQAARQFEIWTGLSAPRSVMGRAARQALGLGSGS